MEDRTKELAGRAALSIPTTAEFGASLIDAHVAIKLDLIAAAPYHSLLDSLIRIDAPLKALRRSVQKVALADRNAGREAMKSSYLLRVFICVMASLAAQFSHATALAQGQSKNKVSGRGLKVAQHPGAKSGGKIAAVRSGTSTDNKPKLIVQLGHTGLVSSIVTSVAFSPEGRFALSGSWDKTARLWEADTGREIRRFGTHPGEVRAVAFSLDGRFVVTASDGKVSASFDSALPEVRVWDAKTGKEAFRLKPRTEPADIPDFRSVAISPDNTLVLAGDAHEQVWVWNVRAGRQSRRFLKARVSPDGRFVLTDTEMGVADLLDPRTGRKIKQFQGKAGGVAADGRYVLTYSDNVIRLWEVETGREKWRLREQAANQFTLPSPGDGFSDFVHVSPNGLYALIHATLWDLKTGKKVREFADYSATMSPDGRYVLTGMEDGTARLWDVETGKEVRRFEGYSGLSTVSGISSDGKYILTGDASANTQAGRVWDLDAGTPSRQFDEICLASSADGKYVLTGGIGGARLRDIDTGAEVRRFEGHSAFVLRGAISSDGRYVLTGGKDGIARLWETGSGREIRQFKGFDVSFSSKNRYILTSGWGMPAILWDTETGQEIRRIGDTTPYEAFSPNAAAISVDGKFVLTGGFLPRLWDAQTGNEVREFIGPNKTFDSGSAVSISADGRYALIGRSSGTVQLWDVATGKLLRQLEEHTDHVLSTAFSPDGRFFITTSSDGTILFGAIPTGKELCRLISLRDGTWIVIDSEGRFDTNNIEEIRGLHWIMPDDPMKPIPIEIFMRDYYEPRLLGRILKGEKLRPVRPVSTLNRVQPGVQIARIEHQRTSPATASITVEVSKAKGRFQRGKKRVELETGVYNLRLFRNGQLVGYAPELKGEVQLDPETGTRAITFSNIKLPRSADSRQIEFSAYAFNVDQVKSPTDRKTLEVPGELPAVKGRAYLISVGINAYGNPDVDLTFAVNDARITQKVLFEHLSRSGEYEKVIQVPLISDYQEKDGQRTIVEKAATKSNIKAVLDLLSGKKVDPEIMKAIPNADEVRQATPEDLVLISFSGHGVADSEGDFYFILYDAELSEESRVTRGVLKRALSSEELSVWLRDIDAAEIVMIADACHSAATVAAEGFKPGPMGSRGLGQLAYDKGMRILASTQADDKALESKLTRQGLLTYALTRDGIEALQADYQPKDNKVLLSELLKYGVKRVPSLYREIETEQLQDFGLGAASRGLVVASGRKNLLVNDKALQRPALFDFSRKRRDVVIVRVGEQ